MLRVSSGFQTLRPSWFQMFLGFGNLVKPSHAFLKYYLRLNTTEGEDMKDEAHSSAFSRNAEDKNFLYFSLRCSRFLSFPGGDRERKSGRAKEHAWRGKKNWGEEGRVGSLRILKCLETLATLATVFRRHCWN